MRKNWKGLLLFSAALLLVATPAAALDDGEEEEGLAAGRITHVEGGLLRYLPDEEVWTPASQDSPIGTGETLYTEDGGRAEFVLPNDTWVRMDGDTQMGILRLEDDLTEAKIDYGSARFYNKDSYSSLEVGTPFGAASTQGEGVFDVYLWDEGLEVVPLEGTVDFTFEPTGRRYEVVSGGPSLLVDKEGVSRRNRSPEEDWDRWNDRRDDQLAAGQRERGESVRYLPSPLQYDAPVLDSYGTWETVSYDGAFRPLWRPIHVSVSVWSPFSVGRWVLWRGRWTWVPNEPFGYVTHHYGNWIFVHDHWYWAPPTALHIIVTDRTRHRPRIPWHPGRVAWIHEGDRVGWVPLAPGEHRSRDQRGPRLHAVSAEKENFRHYKNFSRAVFSKKGELHEGYDRRVRLKGKDAPRVKRDYRPAEARRESVHESPTSRPGFHTEKGRPSGEAPKREGRDAPLKRDPVRVPLTTSSPRTDSREPRDKANESRTFKRPDTKREKPERRPERPSFERTAPADDPIRKEKASPEPRQGRERKNTFPEQRVLKPSESRPRQYDKAMNPRPSGEAGQGRDWKDTPHPDQRGLKSSGPRPRPEGRGVNGGPSGVSRQGRERAVRQVEPRAPKPLQSGPSEVLRNRPHDDVRPQGKPPTEQEQNRKKGNGPEPGDRKGFRGLQQSGSWAHPVPRS